MGLIALIIAFEYTGFFIMQSVFGIDQGGMGLRIFSIIFFALCFKDFLFKSERKEKDWWYMVAIFGFLGLFVYTRLKFGFDNADYEGMLLSFGVRCIPAVIAGILIAKNDEYFYQMQKWLQVLMLFYTVGVGVSVLTSSSSQYLQYKYSAGGMNYQILSYSSAFAFNMNLCLILNWDNVKKFKMFDNGFWKNANKMILIFQIYCMFSGGGRGAVGNIVAVAVFLMYVKSGCKFSVKSVFFTIFFALSVFVAIYMISTKTDNLGANRLIEFFTDTEKMFENERTLLRREAMEVFKINPLVGHGIGSVFYMMTGYSHNMFTDILTEGGIVLFLIAVSIIGKCFFNIKLLVQRNINSTIIYMIFLSSFMMLMFSSYYLIDGGLWFGGAYILYNLSDIREERNKKRKEEMLDAYHKKS